MKMFTVTQTASTNTLMKNWLRGQQPPAGWPKQPPVPCAVRAVMQTGGRGRLGRSFISPPGGVYMSLLLPFDGDPGQVTPRLALAVCRALETFGVTGCGVKWVNDVYLRGKKICGILCEGAEGYLVAGIGVNLFTPPEGYPEGAGQAGAVDASGLEAENVAAEICRQTLKVLTDPGAATEYTARLTLMGRQVVCRTGECAVTGRVTGVDDDFGLMLDTSSGTVVLRTGEVTRVRAVEKAAFFDFDGTMRRGDSIVPFLGLARRKGFMSLKVYLNAGRYALKYYLTKSCTAEEVKEKALSFLPGMEAEERRALCASFAEKLTEEVYPAARRAWDQAGEEGYLRVLLSASPDCYMRDVAKELKADALLCTPVDEQGHISRNCKGEEKVRRALAWAEERGVDMRASRAYGDSGSDAPILRAVGEGWAVNPKRKLKKQGFPICIWRQEKGKTDKAE